MIDSSLSHSSQQQIVNSLPDGYLLKGPLPGLLHVRVREKTAEQRCSLWQIDEQQPREKQPTVLEGRISFEGEEG